MSVLAEGGLEFDFSRAVHAERLDLQGVPIPEGMKLVDFVVTDSSEVLLVEVKDPGQARDPEPAREAFRGRLGTNELINGELVPKARDSYTFLHLMARDDRPMLFVVVVGLDGRASDHALLGQFKSRLLHRLRHEASERWERLYVRDCVVLTPRDWRRLFPHYPLRRRRR
jgi:hypothetical protein